MRTARTPWLAVCLAGLTGLAGCSTVTPPSGAGPRPAPPPTVASLPAGKRQPLDAQAKGNARPRPAAPAQLAQATRPLVTPPLVTPPLSPARRTAWPAAWPTGQAPGGRKPAVAAAPRPSKPAVNPTSSSVVAAQAPAAPLVPPWRPLSAPAPPPPPVVHTVARQPAPAPAAPAPAPVVQATFRQPAPEPPVKTKMTLPHAVAAPDRRSYGDLTAAPCFGHAPDFSWISGQLEYSRATRSWRLRYASVDEEDPYGGSVTLVAHPHLDQVRDGQYVRLQGCFSHPADSGIAPAYRIRTVTIITSNAAAAARATP